MSLPPFKIFSGGLVAFRLKSKLLTSAPGCGPCPPVWSRLSSSVQVSLRSHVHCAWLVSVYYSSLWVFPNADSSVLKVVPFHSLPGLLSFLLQIYSLPQGVLPLIPHTPIPRPLGFIPSTPYVLGLPGRRRCSVDVWGMEG